MTYCAAHPELDQPVPRQVKIKPSSIAGIAGMAFAFAITAPFALMIGKEIFYDPKLRLLLLLIFIGTLIALAALLSFLRKYFQEKKLLVWGKVAEAKTSEGPTYSSGKAGNYMDVQYEFEDSDGNLIKGIKKKFPARDGSWASMAKNIQMLDHPVVLYNRDSSNQHMLYPSLFAYCLLPKRNST